MERKREKVECKNLTTQKKGKIKMYNWQYPEFINVTHFILGKTLHKIMKQANSCEYTVARSYMIDDLPRAAIYTGITTQR